MKRPLLLPALLFAGGVFAADSFGGSLVWPAVAAGLGWLLAAMWARMRTTGLVLALFMAGWLDHAFHQAPLAPHDLRRIADAEPAIVTVRGAIVETPAMRLVERKGELAGRTMVRVSVAALQRSDGWAPVTGDIAVSMAGVLPPGFFRTQRVEVTGVLREPPGPAAEGLFDYRSHLRRQGVWFALQSEGPQDWRLAPDAVTSPPWSERFLPWARSMLSRGLPDDDATRLLAAMALGWKTPLNGDVDDAFMESGTMHVFAISGLHIALIAGMLVQLLRLLRLSRAWCGLVAVPLIWAYVAATGWQPSAVRSAIMSTVVVGGWAVERPGDLINSLAAAALVILVWDPGQLFQASFQLSFGAVAGLGLLVPRLEPVLLRWLRHNPDPFLPDELRPRWQRRLDLPLRWLALSAATCVGAFFSSLPLIWHHFHLLNPVSLLANLLVVPLSSFALAANFASLATGAWWPWLGEMFNASSWVWMRGMVALSRWAADLPGGHRYVASPCWLWWVPYYVLLLGIMTGWALRKARFRWWAAGTALWFGAALTAVIAQQRETRIMVLGGGEAVFVDAPWRAQDLLLDAGGERAAASVVMPFARGNGINRLPAFVATRADVHHLGGAPLVLEKLRPARVFVGPEKSRSPAFGAFVETVETRAIPLRHVVRGEEVAGWQVLHPAADDKFAAADDNALVLSRDCGGVRILWLADLGRHGQRRLAGRGGVKADIVVTGVPDEGEPLGDVLSAAVGPQLVVVAAGKFPAPARVKPAVRRRLADSGTPVLYTSDVGAVTLRMRDGSCEVSAMDGTRLRIRSLGDGR